MLSTRQVIAMHRTTGETLDAQVALSEARRMAKTAEETGSLEYSVLVMRGEAAMTFSSVDSYRMCSEKLAAAGLPKDKADQLARSIVNAIVPNAISRWASVESAMAYAGGDDIQAETKLGLASGLHALAEKNEKEEGKR